MKLKTTSVGVNQFVILACMAGTFATVKFVDPVAVLKKAFHGSAAPQDPLSERIRDWDRRYRELYDRSRVYLQEPVRRNSYGDPTRNPRDLDIMVRDFQSLYTAVASAQGSDELQELKKDIVDLARDIGEHMPSDNSPYWKNQSAGAGERPALSQP